ncbi:MAG: hypothetical protein ACK5QC_05775 [Bacteroidota bacterium]|jgi:hypothetical protein|nr:hypothetical protein [Bacteroidota bacterium]MCA6441813.1 hypothetical protein [Bacteroidota bacterium]
MTLFCKPVNSKKRFAPHRKLDNNYSFTLFDCASSIPENQLTQIIQPEDIFFNKEYLSLIEACTNAKLQTRYCIIFSNLKPIGFVNCQITDFNAGIFGDLIKSEREENESGTLKLLEKYLYKNKDENLLRLFTCGNSIISGEYGFIFREEVGEKEKHDLVIKVLDIISGEEKKTGMLSAILIKDFEEPLRPKQLFKSSGYEMFSVEPNLIVEIPSQVESIEDYVQLFSKKYRNRSKTIQKKFSSVEVRELQYDEIVEREDSINTLYLQVFERAKFKLLQLPKNYFSRCKAIFDDKFTLTGFFLNQKLIGFNSSFNLSENKFEAHYIGIDYSLNREYELYQNTLCNLISSALSKEKHHVNLGRTAAEIKTTIGAKPRDLLCYIKAQNTLSKLIQKSFIRFLQPEEWIPRNPFKEE